MTKLNRKKAQKMKKEGNQHDNRPIKLFEVLTTTSPNKVFLSMILGGLGGITYSIFVPLVLLSLQPSLSRILQPEANSTYWFMGMVEVSSPSQAQFFFITCLIILFCRGISGTLMTQVSTDSQVRLRKNMYGRISKLPIQKLDEIGPSRLITALNNDIQQIADGAAAIPIILIAMMTLFGMLGYLIYVRIEIFLFVIGLIAFGYLTYQIPVKFGTKHMSRGRDNFDQIQEGIKGLIYGAKELKLNTQKQEAFLSEELHRIENKFSASHKKGRTFIIFAMQYSNLISFFTIGAVTYVIANYYTLTRDDLLGAVMVLLYIMGPLTVLVNAVHPLVQANIAARKLNALYKNMPIETISATTVEQIDCQHTLEVKNLEYGYPASKDGEPGFHVGPINLKLSRGEITYLVGGNGSGKTTLAKMLSLHYIPDNGDIYFDEQIVTKENRGICRQSISAIFSDFYLFKKLFGLSGKELDSRAAKYLKLLGLEGKVTVKDGQFSSTSLSDGQKKRLALLVAYLEDRSIYIFDEWAADQDPEFKEIFYYHILPDLKKHNKMIIVITHDDRYFHLADNLVRMENGKVLEGEAFKKIEELEKKEHGMEAGYGI